MRTYRILKEGKKKARIPSPERDPVLDYLYEFKVANEDELLAQSKDAREKLNDYVRKGYVEVLHAV